MIRLVLMRCFRILFIVISFFIYSNSLCALKPELTDEVFARTKPGIIAYVYYMLKITDIIFSRYKITYWIDFGSLLGLTRHCGMIPWDDDVDIVIFSSDESKLFGLKKQFAHYGLCIKRSSIPGLIKILPIKSQFPFVDIFMVKHCPEDKNKIKLIASGWPKYYWTNDELFPLNRTRFGPMQINAPKDPMRHLFDLYGQDCMTMACLWNHSSGAGKWKDVKVKIKDFGPAKFKK